MNTHSSEISITQRLARAKAEDFNDAQAEAFADRMVEALNFATLALMISVGHRTRLFDVMARIDPATSEQIARAARLDERYAREWLGAMAPALSTLMEPILPLVPGMAEAICMLGNCGLKPGLQTVTQHLSKGINRIRK